MVALPATGPRLPAGSATGSPSVRSTRRHDQLDASILLPARCGGVRRDWTALAEAFGVNRCRRRSAAARDTCERTRPVARTVAGCSRHRRRYRCGLRSRCAGPGCVARMPATRASFSRAPGLSVALPVSNSTSDTLTIRPRAVSRVSRTTLSCSRRRSRSASLSCSACAAAACACCACSRACCASASAASFAASAFALAASAAARACSASDCAFSAS